MRPGNAHLDAAQLATQFDLTPAESRLAAMLASGKTVAEAATSLGIAMPTARSHLRAIFGKTGTRRQSELTLHLLTSLAALTMATNRPENQA
jgi:DNA-binding CsgD family transcriptional regulator